MLSKKKFNKSFAMIWLLISIALAGCSQNDNASQQTTDISNNNNVPLTSNTAATNNTENTSENYPSSNVAAVSPDQNKNKKASPPVNQPTPVVGSGGNDMFLFVQIRGALNSNKDLADSVAIELKEDTVILTGNVLNEDQKKKAEQIVRGIKGVKNVKNNLRVSS